MLKKPSMVLSGVIIACILCSLQLNSSAQSSSDIHSYIQEYKQIALDQEREFGIPAPITIAQGILESSAGKSGLTRNSNNHFGIKKGVGWNGALHYAWDDEPQKSAFRVYSSAAESYKDHSRFLKENERYRSLFSKSIYDYRGWAIGLQKAGYATSPTYAKALIGYIDTYKLYEINGGVKLRPGKTITITRTITREELVERKDLQMNETEESEEQESLEKATRKFVVEINGIRCTILYPGETLSSIAMKYDISKRDLLQYNESTNENDFQEGDIVFLGKKKKKYEGALDFYRAKDGESLYAISQQFGIKLANLSKMNKISSFSVLKEGEKLYLK